VPEDIKVSYSKRGPALTKQNPTSRTRSGRMGTNVGAPASVLPPGASGLLPGSRDLALDFAADRKAATGK